MKGYAETQRRIEPREVFHGDLTLSWLHSLGYVICPQPLARQQLLMFRTNIVYGVDWGVHFGCIGPVHEDGRFFHSDDIHGSPRSIPDSELDAMIE